MPLPLRIWARRWYKTVRPRGSRWDSAGPLPLNEGSAPPETSLLVEMCGVVCTVLKLKSAVVPDERQSLFAEMQL